MSEPIKTLTGAQLMAMEQQYAQGFIGGQWTHRVVPQLFMAVRESFATIATLTARLTELEGADIALEDAIAEMRRWDAIDRALIAEQRVKELDEAGIEMAGQLHDARNALPLHLAKLEVYSEAMDRIGELTRSDADKAMNIAYDAMDEIDRIIKGEK